MGYETFFNLEIGHQPGIELQDVAKTLCDVMGDDDPAFWTSVLEGNIQTKWYDYGKDMVQVSLRHPDALFTLRGEGEESDDQWLTYYMGGKVQMEHMPEWTPAPFDPTKLQDPE